MLTEEAKVLTVEENYLCIEIQRSNHCSGCSVRSSCGHRLLSALHPQRQMQVKINGQGLHVKAGDTVRMGIEENVILRLSALFYLLPLLSMMLILLVMDWFAFDEPWLIIAALLGLALGFLGLGTMSREKNCNAKYQAVLLPSLNGK